MVVNSESVSSPSPNRGDLIGSRSGKLWLVEKMMMIIMIMIMIMWWCCLRWRWLWLMVIVVVVGVDVARVPHLPLVRFCKTVLEHNHSHSVNRRTGQDPRSYSHPIASKYLRSGTHLISHADIIHLVLVVLLTSEDCLRRCGHLFTTHCSSRDDYVACNISRCKSRYRASPCARSSCIRST